MALADLVTARYPARELVNLTNPQDESGTTVDTDRLGYACDDVEADFEIYSGVEFDATDSRHVSVAVDGVVLKLLKRTGHSVKEGEEESWRKRLYDLGRVTARDRIFPSTNSLLEPTADTSGQRPAFDDDRFDDLIPGGPPA